MLFTNNPRLLEILLLNLIVSQPIGTAIMRLVMTEYTQSIWAYWEWESEEWKKKKKDKQNGWHWQCGSFLCHICAWMSSRLPHFQTSTQERDDALKCIQGNWKGESVVVAILPSPMEVSYCTSRFFHSRPSNFVKSELPFPLGLKSHTHIGYRAVNHAVMIMCADHAKWLCQIQRYNNSPPYVTARWLPPHSINTGGRKRPNSLF